MSPANKSMNQMVASTANKLRMIQISFADEQSEERRDYMIDAVERALEHFSVDEKRTFVKALRARFPAGELGPVQAAAPRKTKQEQTETPEELAERLVQKAELLDDEDKKALTEKLAQVGLTAITKDSTPFDAQATDREKIQLPKRINQTLQYLMNKRGISTLDMSRMIKLLIFLSDFVSSADSMIWNTWKNIAPRSPVRRTTDLRKEISAYLSGSKKVSGNEIRDHVEQLQKLTASIIAGVGQVSSYLARKHLAKLSPIEIETQVNREGGGGIGILGSKEAKCWNKFVNLARELEEDIVEHAIREGIAKYTESLMKQAEKQ